MGGKGRGTRNQKSGVPSESWRGNAEYGTCFSELPQERKTGNWMGELYTPSLTKEVVGQALAFRRQKEMFGER